MKILVAGSTGLVGKTLITDFLQEHEVIAISRRPFKFPNNVKQELIDFDKDFILKPADHFFICLGYSIRFYGGFFAYNYCSNCNTWKFFLD